MACSRKLSLVWVDASQLEIATKTSSPADYDKAWRSVSTAQGILVPGGFGHRGTEGMIAAAEWARTNKTPYLGICLGMQIAVIEFARNLCNLPKAGSEEFNNGTPDKVIKFMPEIDPTTLGGTMRLGIRPTHFQQGSEWSKLRALYHASAMSDSTSSLQNGTTSHDSPPPSSVIHPPTTTTTTTSSNCPVILERHRHRYEVNPAYVPQLTARGLSFIGKDDSGDRMEILELQDHPWYVGVQFHPEYLSRVLKPSKPYLGFVAASAGCLDEVTAGLTMRTSSSGEVNGVLVGMEGVKI